MFRNNRNLVIIALIAVINSLGYGIIIPILLTYSTQYGLNFFQNGLLFALFSLCQFLATPIIGRLSDKYGRKPLLVSSVFGTALSFFMMAFAPSAAFLFIARALDGITAGNIPVASAVISDSTTEKDRAKGFGIIGAAFGFGFVFGPLISSFTVQYGLNVPFIIAGVVSLITVAITAKFLPETNKHMVKDISMQGVFDFKKLFSALSDKATGTTLLISLIYNIAFGLFIFAFQPYAKEVLKLTDTEVGMVYTLYGLVGLITQGIIIPQTMKRIGEKKGLLLCFITVSIALFIMGFVKVLPQYALVSVAFGVANGFFLPIIQSLLSKEVDARSQGTILGLNSSYVSLGMIIGPILGGTLALFAVPLPFVAASFLSAICIYITITKLNVRVNHKESLI